MMFRLRRFAPALVALFVVQLLVLGAGFGCALPAAGNGGDSGAAADLHDPASGHAHHGMDAGVSGDLVDGRNESTLPDDPHDGPAHCASAMACATAVIASTPALMPDAGILAVRTATPLDPTAPAAVFGTPETPPPRV